jgi:hypothetical protein
LTERELTLFTDYKPLTFLTSQKTFSNQKLAEWKETFLRFKINIVYRSSIPNIIPDILSRAFPESVLNDDHHKQVAQGMASQSSKAMKEFLMVMSISHSNESVQLSPHTGSDDATLRDLQIQSNVSFAQTMMDGTKYLVPSPDKREALFTEVHAFGHYGHHAII